MLMFAHKLNIVASDIWLSPGIGIAMVRVAVARKEQAESVDRGQLDVLGTICATINTVYSYEGGKKLREKNCAKT